jgi:hypothetical protein
MAALSVRPMLETSPMERRVKMSENEKLARGRP